MVEGLQQGEREHLEDGIKKIFNFAKRDLLARKDPLRWLFRLAKKVESSGDLSSEKGKLLENATRLLFSTITSLQAELQKVREGRHLFAEDAASMAAQLQGIQGIEEELGTVHALLEKMDRALQQHNLTEYIHVLLGLEVVLNESKPLKAVMKRASAALKNVEGKVKEEVSLMTGIKRFTRTAFGLAALFAAAAVFTGCAASQHGQLAAAGELEAADWAEEAKALYEKSLSNKEGRTFYSEGEHAGVLSDGSVIGWVEKSMGGYDPKLKIPLTPRDLALQKAQAYWKQAKKGKAWKSPGFGGENLFYDEDSGVTFVRLLPYSEGELRRLFGGGKAEYKPAGKSEFQLAKGSAGVGKKKVLPGGDSVQLISESNGVYTFKVRVRQKDPSLAQSLAQSDALAAFNDATGRARSVGKGTTFAAGKGSILRTMGGVELESGGWRTFTIVVAP